MRFLLSVLLFVAFVLSSCSASAVQPLNNARPMPNELIDLSVTSSVTLPSPVNHNFSSPAGLSFDSSGTLWISSSDSKLSPLVKYNLGGLVNVAVPRRIEASATGSAPAFLQYFVGNNDQYRFGYSTGSDWYTTTIGSQAHSIAIDPLANLGFFSMEGDRSISWFFSNSTDLKYYTLTRSLTNPRGLAIHPNSRALYAVDASIGTVLIVSLDGKTQPFADGFQNAQSLTFDNLGTLYVSHSQGISAVHQSGGQLLWYKSSALIRGLAWSSGSGLWMSFPASGLVTAVSHQVPFSLAVEEAVQYSHLLEAEAPVHVVLRIPAAQAAKSNSIFIRVKADRDNSEEALDTRSIAVFASTQLSAPSASHSQFSSHHPSAVELSIPLDHTHNEKGSDDSSSQYYVSIVLHECDESIPILFQWTLQ